MNGQMRFSHMARGVARITGHPAAFLVAAAIVLGWAMLGPVFDFSDTWQLVINTGTTIVTFLMVFLIQHSQNRDTIAMQVKLDELVRSIKAARNSVLNLEELEEGELELLLQKYQQLGSEAREKMNGGRSALSRAKGEQLDSSAARPANQEGVARNPDNS